ncbi:MAG: hypothetical protein RLZZ383_1392 [Pseudomonadota bacterium]|jgi:23S rRNA pseudouridine2605 synthase
MLPRWLSAWNVASRREAEAWVAAGRVRVDGRVVRDVTAWVLEGARVEVDGARVGPASAPPQWWMLHKPRGCVTTTHDPEGRPTVMTLVPPAAGLAPVGRLDRDSQGLLLLTQDHGLAASLTAPETHVTKVYRVKVRGRPSERAMLRLRTTTLHQEGLALGPLGLAPLEETSRGSWWEVTLTEGKNRQIRRRFEHEGHPVETLIRVAFGPLRLGDLRPGLARRLTAAEVAALAAVASGRDAAGERVGGVDVEV